MSLQPPADLGFGIGLRKQHYAEILDFWPPIDWFEVISENFMVAGGRPRATLERVCEHYPVVLHGVSLSIGSTDPLDLDYLRHLKRLAEQVRSPWVSDHLCWTGVGGHNLHDLLPLPYTAEVVDHVVDRVRQVQDVLGRRLVLENVSTYLEFSVSSMPEWEFLSTIAERADCEILLDVNNIFVSAFNHRFDARQYIRSVPAQRVRQYHLAGHSDRGTFLHDTHDHPVSDAVWDLYAEALRVIGPRATLIEWDDHIPPLAQVVAHAEKARQISRSVTEDERTRGDAKAALETDHLA
jgi:uncharacterized protein